MVRALDDASRDVRTSALRLAERWLSNPDSPVVAAVLKRLDDADWNVRRQLAATLGEMRQADKHAAIATLLERHGDDPVTVDAAVSSVAGSETAVLDRLLLAPAASPQRTSAIVMLSASILMGGQEPAIQRLFDLMAEDTRAAWQRGALMLGAEVAVLGAPAPDTPGGRGRGARTARRRRAVPDVPWRARGTGGSDGVQSQSWRQPRKPAAPGSGDHARARAGAGAARAEQWRRAWTACGKGARSRGMGRQAGCARRRAGAAERCRPAAVHGGTDPVPGALPGMSSGQRPRPAGSRAGPRGLGRGARPSGKSHTRHAARQGRRGRASCRRRAPP